MNEMKNRTEADAVAEIVARHVDVQEIEFTDAEGNELKVLAVPSGMKLESVKKFEDEYATKPSRKKGTATFFDLDSFIAHANRFKDDDSILFADPSPGAPKLGSVLDYHRKGASDPRFGEHKGLYRFPLSEEWTAWSRVHGEALTQTNFAEHIEDRILDVVDGDGAQETAKSFIAPLGVTFASPAKMLELAKGLTIRQNAVAKEVRNSTTGEVSIAFETTNTDADGAPLKVPSALLLQIPIFRGGAVYQIPARLRHKLHNGRLTWTVDLYRADRMFQHAFDGACKRAKDETGLPLFLGTPEA